MARIAARGFWSQLRAGARAVCLCLVAAGLLPGSGIAQVQTVKGEAAFSASDGYAGLLLKVDHSGPNIPCLVSRIEWWLPECGLIKTETMEKVCFP